MSEPFRFSMRQMFGSVTLLCIAASAASLAFKFNIYDSIPASTLAAAGALFGAGVGTLFRKTITGAAFGFLIVGVPMNLLRELLQGAPWH